MAFCLGVYYLLPFVRWDRGPGAPDQAVLVDFPGRRFYFFFIELWPQEVYYFTGLLIMAAMTLFLLNAIGGRIWCGYWCPQTVWTDLFLAVERWVEGDRRERMRKAKSRLTPRRAGEIALKHSIWLFIAWWTGGAWVLYFADAPTLVKDLATFQAPLTAYLFIAILTFTTYALAGHMREQVCIYMCPWPRIQAALTDEWALNVTYRYDRGEPRMAVWKAKQAKAKGEPAGDCITCHQCIAVCPTGVDIREGSQLGCIQCGLCIDACNNMMTKIGRPPGLIAYDNDVNIKRRQAGEKPIYRFIRPRTIIYLAIIIGTGLLMLYSLAARTTLDINVLHDRNPLFVTLSDGSVRNAYTIRVLNKSNQARTIEVSASGMPDAKLTIVGADGRPVVSVGRDQTEELRVLLTVPASAALEKSTRVRFRVRDVDNGNTATENEHFIAR
jgi:cytochrome c oxidase accessory protein FixG